MSRKLYHFFLNTVRRIGISSCGVLNSCSSSTLFSRNVHIWIGSEYHLFLVVLSYFVIPQIV